MANRFTNKLRGLVNLGSDDINDLLAATSRPRRFAARRDLVREGDKPGALFVVLEGWACRYKILPNGARQILGFLMPGDSCDLHLGLVDEMDHSIQTVTSALVAAVDRVEMDAIMQRRPAVMKALYVAQLIDEGILRAWITSMGRRSSIERIAHLMCELYLRARDVGLATEPQFALPLSQLLLADSLGMTPVHLNRVLKELRLSGAMTFQRGSLTIANPDKLAQIAGFDSNYLHRRLQIPVRTTAKSAMS